MNLAWESDATNLAPGDTNSATDVFIRNPYNDLLRNPFAASGGLPNGPSMTPFVSGNQLLFASGASNLVAGDTNGFTDIFSMEIDRTPPTDPAATPAGHTPNVFSRDRTIQINWNGATDPSGIDGYSFLFDRFTLTHPDITKEAEETAAGTTSASLADGTWFFHLATIDTEGNETRTVHLGPFKIDRTPPTSVAMGALPSSTQATRFTIRWSARDALSGVASYDVRFRRAPFGGRFGSFATLRSRTTTKSMIVNVAERFRYCFSVRARDRAGNLSLYSSERCISIV